jgi:hypothetical protein
VISASASDADPHWYAIRLFDEPRLQYMNYGGQQNHQRFLQAIWIEDFKMNAVRKLELARMVRRVLRVLLPTLVVLGPGRSGRPDDYPHLRMGNPSQAPDDGNDKNIFLMKKDLFAVSYNNTVSVIQTTPTSIRRQADPATCPRS